MIKLISQHLKQFVDVKKLIHKTRTCPELLDAVFKVVDGIDQSFVENFRVLPCRALSLVKSSSGKGYFFICREFFIGMICFSSCFRKEYFLIRIFAFLGLILVTLASVANLEADFNLMVLDRLQKFLPLISNGGNGLRAWSSALENKNILVVNAMARALLGSTNANLRSSIRLNTNHQMTQVIAALGQILARYLLPESNVRSTQLDGACHVMQSLFR